MIVFKKFQKEKFNKFLVDLKPLENKSEAYAQNISHTYWPEERISGVINLL